MGKKEGVVLSGNERGVRFWRDKWCGDSPLSMSFLSLFALAVDEKAWLVDIWDSSTEGERCYLMDKRMLTKQKDLQGANELPRLIGMYLKGRSCSCSPDSPLTNPSGGVDYLNHGDIPDRVEEVNQCALSNQVSESCTPKDSIVRSHKEVSGEFLIDGLSPGKWPKCESWNVRGLGSRNKRRMVKDFLRSENPDVVMIQETKKENCDRRFVGSVWTVRNKDGLLFGVWGIRWDFDHLGFKKF
ncbi:hypothetical protein CK203_020982 [Vitis vinifera]|uniref:Endonuclease/exonuclease/phosphatase domain-containing protein n=1 Tax=Vitis vinifera TaxID=29760 RepID=A0A438JX59_VITVI|nr:hypothetical protein CK203_020982 [Vitis vinifera]